MRGCTPKPGAFAALKGIVLKVSKCKLEQADGKIAEPGEIVSVEKDGFVVAAGTGSVGFSMCSPKAGRRCRGLIMHVGPGSRRARGSMSVISDN